MQSIIYPIAGVRIGTAKAHIRYPDRRDLVLFELDPKSHVAAVFTQNAFCAAPVVVAKTHLAQQTPRALIINTGNANAATGEAGLSDAQLSCKAVAQVCAIQPEQVLPFSTGVIGESLPVSRLVAGIPAAFLDLNESHWTDAAQGIMTTDTRPKVASRHAVIAGKNVHVTGIAKGAGMIEPNMATMLSFIATDVNIQPDLLQHMLNSVVADSFNSITIDGDTSTNDACVLVATGCGELGIAANTPEYSVVLELLRELAIELAQAIVRDGEGATKFIRVHVEQGYDIAECREIAYSIARSPLIKTAFFASDPNWGRIAMAIGKANVPHLDVQQIHVFLDAVQIVQNGGRAQGYTEAQGQAVMQQSDITVRVCLGRGKAQATIWTSDLSYDYVKINADYRS